MSFPYPYRFVTPRDAQSAEPSVVPSDRFATRCPMWRVNIQLALPKKGRLPGLEKRSRFRKDQI